MAALGYEYDCIGLQIWLRRLTEPYPLAYRDVCIN